MSYSILMTFNLDNLPKENFENGREKQKALLIRLAQELGFVENEEALALRNQLVYEKGFEENKDKYIEWYTKCLEIVFRIKDETENEKAGIGLILVCATIYEEFYNDDEYYDALDEALEYAHSRKQDEIVAKILEAIK